MDAVALVLRPIEWVPGLRVLFALLLGLGVATAISGHTRRAGSSGSLHAQVTSWWLLLPPVFVAWAFHPLGAAALVLVISALAAHELAEHARRPRSRRMWLCVSLLSALQLGLCWAGLGALNIILMIALAGGALYRWHSGNRAQRDPLLLAVFAFQAAGLWCLAELTPSGMAASTAAAWFLLICVVTALNDIGQFLVGTRFGRHKLAPSVSPNKTWQGLGGGIVVSAVSCWVVGRALGLTGTGWLGGFGVVLSLAGVAGDLVFSAGKRALGIKDYGRLIPGHGGILDRVDSLVLTAPAAMIALRVM